MLRAGKLRHSITLQTNTPAQNASTGDITDSWATTQTGIAAEVRAVAGGETVRGRQMAATTSHLVTIHYRTGVNPKQRFVWGSLTLYITRAEDPDGTRRELECQCERVSDG